MRMVEYMTDAMTDAMTDYCNNTVFNYGQRGPIFYLISKLKLVHVYYFEQLIYSECKRKLWYAIEK